jgi:hypothetical protein
MLNKLLNADYEQNTSHLAVASDTYIYTHIYRCAHAHAHTHTHTYDTTKSTCCVFRRRIRWAWHVALMERKGMYIG